MLRFAMQAGVIKQPLVPQMMKVLQRTPGAASFSPHSLRQTCGFLSLNFINEVVLMKRKGSLQDTGGRVWETQ